jgi:hypothetical protein
LPEAGCERETYVRSCGQPRYNAGCDIIAIENLTRRRRWDILEITRARPGTALHAGPSQARGAPDRSLCESVAMVFQLTGQCGCGAVRFELTQPFVSAAYCHCTRCQRRTGTAASANARAAPGSFRVVAGEDRLRAWRPEAGAEKWFCGDCGSALFSRSPENADQVGVRLGALDGDPGIRPDAHQFVAYAASWEPLPDDGLPHYPEGRPAA